MCEKSNRERLIEKIKALLDHTTDRGASEAEAIAFALKAQKLMAENAITEAELFGAGEAREVTTSFSDPLKGLWVQWLNKAVADNFRCRSFNRKTRDDSGRYLGRRFVFLGYPSDVAAAKQVFDHLFAVGTRLASDYVARMRKVYVSVEGFRNCYLNGYVKGIRTALEKQTQALMLVCPQEVADAYDALDIAKGKKTAVVHYQFVYDDGRQAGMDAVKAGRIDAFGDECLLSA